MGWIVAGATAVFSLLWMLQESFCTELSKNDTCVRSVPNPIGVSGVANPEQSFLGDLLLGLILLGALAAVASLFRRFRTAGAVERQQVKWVMFSIGLFIGFTLLIDVVLVEALERPEPPGYGLIQQILWVMIPASIAVAILRYKLYEIDRLVSRTLSYTLIALALGAVYARGVIGLQTLLPVSDDLAVAASTLTAVALFAPLRRRVQHWVDRRFNRRRYDAEQVVEAFSARLRDAVDLDTVTRDLHAVVATTVQPVSAALWLREQGRP